MVPGLRNADDVLSRLPRFLKLSLHYWMVSGLRSAYCCLRLSRLPRFLKLSSQYQMVPGLKTWEIVGAPVAALRAHRLRGSPAVCDPQDIQHGRCWFLRNANEDHVLHRHEFFELLARTHLYLHTKKWETNNRLPRLAVYAGFWWVPKLSKTSSSRLCGFQQTTNCTY